jgi:hypothetical protein
LTEGIRTSVAIKNNHEGEGVEVIGRLKDGITYLDFPVPAVLTAL